MTFGIKDIKRWKLFRSTASQQAAGATGPVAADKFGVGIGPDALPVLSAFVSGIKGPLASYAAAIDPSTGVSLTNVRPPWLWHGTQGFVEFLSNTLIKGVGYGVGSKVYAVGTATGDQNWYVYDKTAPGLWAKKTGAAINAGGGILNTVFTSSTGVHFLSWAPNGGAGAQKLYRSTDDGATWTAVLTSTQLTFVNDYIGSIDEDEIGVLMCTAYNGVENPCTKGVYKSTDGGATWANIYTAVALANDYARHVHTVVYDPYRSTWWVSGGDGVATAICYSTDRGATWTAWALSFQATVMIPTPTAFIFQADISGYHDIIRVPAAAALGPAAVAAQDPRNHVVLKMGTKRTPVAPIAGLAGDEFAFNAYRDGNGICCISAGKSATGRAAFFVSADDGATWTDALGGTSTTQSAAAAAGVTIFGWEPIRPSRYAAWDGWQIGYPNATTYVSRRFRVMPPATLLHVNPSTGDDIGGDGIAAPLASLDHGNLPSGTRLILDADLTSGGVVTLTTPGVIVDRSGFALGATDGGGTLTVNETFEGTYSGTTSVAGTGTAVTNSAANPYVDPFLPAGGTKHGRVAITTANDTAILQWAGALTGIADGVVASFKARLYVTAATITSVLTLFQIQSFINVGCQTTAAGGGLQVTVVPQGSAIYQQHTLDLAAMPLNTYFAIKLVVFKHATRGWVKVYQVSLDGPDKIMKLVLYVRDINTSGAWANARVGIISGGQANLTIDVDNVALAKGFDCDFPPAYVLGGQGQVVLPDMARS